MHLQECIHHTNLQTAHGLAIHVKPETEAASIWDGWDGNGQEFGIVALYMYI